ncbi:MAG: DUF2927 domain-containing protein [Pseudomonadota bacterium]
MNRALPDGLRLIRFLRVGSIARLAAQTRAPFAPLPSDAKRGLATWHRSVFARTMRGAVARLFASHAPLQQRWWGVIARQLAFAKRARSSAEPWPAACRADTGLARHYAPPTPTARAAALLRPVQRRGAPHGRKAQVSGPRAGAARKGRLLRRLLPLGLVALLAACAVEGPAPSVARAPVTVDILEEVRFPRQSRPRGVTRSNVTLAQDFLDLTFALESGQQLPGLLRYEGPVRVVLQGASLAPYRGDLERLLGRLRSEAGVDIRSTDTPIGAQLFVEGVSMREIQRVYPGAACFIVPGVTSWAEFQRKAGRNRLRWSDQTTLGITGIFIPVDSTPQDVRDCLLEEIGQALGPANDVYRLADTVFNDDNFHSILTPFDMLMLRTLYSPELRSGMPKQVVAGRLPDILDRINPGGRGVGAPRRAPESRVWKRAIEAAMTRRNAVSARLRAVDDAVAIANAMQPVDHRLAVALMTRGRLSFRTDPARAAVDFASAYQLLRGRFGTDDIRTAQASLHLAMFALRRGDFPQALSLAETATGPAEAGENAVLLSGLLAIRAEAHRNLGDVAAAQSNRLESLKWARFAFGDVDGAIARAEAQLAALGPVAIPAEEVSR